MSLWLLILILTTDGQTHAYFEPVEDGSMKTCMTYKAIAERQRDEDPKVKALIAECVLLFNERQA